MKQYLLEFALGVSLAVVVVLVAAAVGISFPFVYQGL